jgi:molecular chaperone HscA
MALLQISEPGNLRRRTSSAAPSASISARRTRWSQLCAAESRQCFRTRKAGLSCRRSCVIRPTGRVEVGYAAQAHQTEDPTNTIVSVKRFMGRGRKDVPYIEKPALRLRRRARHGADLHRRGHEEPVEVSAEILKVLRARAEISLGGDLSGAVITVPAYFDDAQRQATKDAATWPAST